MGISISHNMGIELKRQVWQQGCLCQEPSLSPAVGPLKKCKWERPSLEMREQSSVSFLEFIFII